MSVLDTQDVTVNAPEPVVPAGRRRLLSSWAATVTATAVSTYALDGVATAAGVVLVASGALGGVGSWHALVFPHRHLRGVECGAASEPARYLVAARTDGDEHKRAVEGGPRPDATQAHQRPRTPDRLGGRLSGPRVGQGGSLLRRRGSERPCSATRSPPPTPSFSSPARTSAAPATSTRSPASGSSSGCASRRRACPSTLIRCGEGTLPGTPAGLSPRRLARTTLQQVNGAGATRPGRRAPWVPALPGQRRPVSPVLRIPGA